MRRTDCLTHGYVVATIHPAAWPRLHTVTGLDIVVLCQQASEWYGPGSLCEIVRGSGVRDARPVGLVRQEWHGRVSLRGLRP